MRTRRKQKQYNFVSIILLPSKRTWTHTSIFTFRSMYNKITFLFDCPMFKIWPINNTHIIVRSLLQSFLLFSCSCWLLQCKNLYRALGYPWVCRVKQHKFIVYSSEWLFSAGGSWHYLSCPPFPFDLAHLSSTVPGSLLELPPRWLCPLDGEEGGDGGDGRDGRGAQRGGGGERGGGAGW